MLNTMATDILQGMDPKAALQKLRYDAQGAPIDAAAP